MEEFIHTGKIVASHGTLGDLILVHSLGKKSLFKDIEAIFIEELKGSFIPYFIEKTNAKSQEETLIKLEGVNSKEATIKLLQKKVWLLHDDFQKVAAKSSSIALLGFCIIEKGINIGQVNEVIEQPHQILVQILYKNKEAYIPLHQESLLKIDRKKKEIHVNLPDGLLEVYS